MEVTAKKDHDGLNVLEIGPVTLELQTPVIQALYDVVNKRLSESTDAEKAATEKKLQAYRTLAAKMKGVDDRIVQKFATELKPEHLVTLVRLAGGNDLYKKVLKNLSKQNRRQFEMDYDNLNRITKHQACVYMEQIVPHIKKAAQEQKRLQAQL